MKRGFTLLEIIVAMAVFTVVVVIILSVLLSTINANRKSQSTQIAVSNLNSAVERMVRELREGNSYDCIVGTPELDDCAGGGSEITFLNVDGLRVVYRLAGNTIERSEDGGGTFSAITGADAVVENLMFFVHGNASTNRQPKVLIVVKGYGEEGATKTRTEFSLQTTVSARPDPAIFLEDSGSGEGEAGGPVSGGPTSGLVAHWPFDGNLDDIAGGNNGTFIGGTPNYVAGKVGSFALDFDGVDQYVNLGSGAALDNLGPLSISAWVKADIDQANNRIYNTDVTGQNNEGYAFAMDAGGTLRLSVDVNNPNLEVVSSDNSVAVGTWQHVLVTWDGSLNASGVHFYVNGSEVSYKTQINGAGGTFDDSPNDKLIGFKNNAPSGDAFDGLIDDVRIYNRALSASEIQAIYNAAP